MTTLRVACVQMTSTTDVDANLASARRLVERAATEGAEWVLLPEAFAFIGSNDAKQAILESLPDGGPILEACRAMARDNGVHLVLGGFHEAAPDGKSFNTCVHLDGNGEIAASYRKIHMFAVDLPDGTRLNEGETTLSGEELVLTDTPVGPFGLTICYDVRFPAMYQELAKRGAVALTVPSAFTESTGKDHWHVLLRARAVECQCYVLAPAQWGSHGGRRRSYGHALIVDPWGCVVAECSDGEGLASATLDTDLIQRVRRQLPSLEHRRI